MTRPAIKNHLLGNLRIYVESSHKVRHGSRNLFRKLFPQAAYMHIVKEARKAGIMNATVHTTQVGFTPTGKIEVQRIEEGNSLAMVVELIDKREILEAFFLKHTELLREKVIIYKDVEFWDVD